MYADFGSLEKVFSQRLPKSFKTVEFTQSLLAEQQRFRDLIYTIEHVIVDGDRVSVGWSAEGRPVDPLAVDSASREKLTWSGLTVWQIANGKMVAGWSIDTGSLCQTESLSPLTKPIRVRLSGSGVATAR